MKRIPYTCLLLVLFGILVTLLPIDLQGQGWVRLTEAPIYRHTRRILEFPNSDYLVVAEGSDSIHELAYAFRISPAGDTLWTREIARGYGSQYPDASFYITGAAIDANGGFVVIGSQVGEQDSHFVALKHVDDFGNTMWTQYHGPGDGMVVEQTSDGGYIIGAQQQGLSGSTLNRYYFVVKTDSLGNSQWTQQLPHSSTGYFDWAVEYSMVIKEVPSGGYMVMATREQDTHPHGTFWMRLGANGQIQSQVIYGDAPYYHQFYMNDMVLKADGTMAIVATDTNSDYALILADSAGAIQSIHHDPQYHLSMNYLTSICEVHDGGFLLAGGDAVIRTNATGNVLWAKRLPNFQAAYLQIMEDADSFFLVSSMPVGPMPRGIMVAKLDYNGNLHSNLLSGKAYWDQNQNCIQDIGETTSAGWLVQVQPGSFYATTDSTGYYEIQVDTGSYTLQMTPPSQYFGNSCPPTGLLTHTFTTTYDTASGLDFGFEDLIQCPLLEVEIATSILRRCYYANYEVTYCNIGSVAAPNALVQVNLDPWQTFVTASIPWTLSQSGDTVEFQLGNLAPFDCGAISMTVMTSCDTTITGLTHCVEAHIYPDSNCLPLNTLWDQASIDVSGTCINEDTVSFRISNVGTGNMSSPGGLVILEDDIMSITGSFDLPSNQDTVIKIPANGRTMALLAQQRPGHPGNSMPRAFVEGCGFNLQGGFSIGHVLTQAQDEIDPFVAIDCHQNVSPFDPNDKNVVPEGMGANHIISANDQLDYTIRFQNTGTDTAFTVRLRDQLDVDVDPLTFHPGPSSHPYTWQISNQGLLEFTFANIQLPDSNVDEPGSHGFVSYTIRQQPGNPDGTWIDNEADIYFDFNPAVRTNATHNQVGSEPWTHLVFTPDPTPTPPMQVQVYPNPFTRSATIDLGVKPFRNLEFELWDAQGQLVLRQSLHGTSKIELLGGQLDPGLYLFKIAADGKTMNGKAVLMR